ncbi:MAG TPA: TlpA disulfide reductase family protein [Solimonas sp.]
MKLRALGALAGLLLCVALPSPAQTGPAAPSIWLPQADGTPTGLRDLRGQVVLVDFWASWCAPCLKSLPQLEGWYGELRARGFTVLAVNVDTERKKALAFLKRKPVRYPVVYDAEGWWPEQYGVGGMPASYLVDRQGRLRQSYSGYSEKDLPRIRRDVEALLAEGETR